MDKSIALLAPIVEKGITASLSINFHQPVNVFNELLRSLSKRSHKSLQVIIKMPHRSLGLSNHTYNTLRRTLRGIHAPSSSADSSTRTICTVCQDTPTQPIVLRCAHVFCLGCLEEAAYQLQRRCPNCRQPYKSVYVLLDDMLCRMDAHEQVSGGKAGGRTRAERGVSYSRSRSRSRSRERVGARETEVRPSPGGGDMAVAPSWRLAPTNSWVRSTRPGSISRFTEPVAPPNLRAAPATSRVRSTDVGHTGNRFTYIPAADGGIWGRNGIYDPGYEAFQRSMAVGDSVRREGGDRVRDGGDWGPNEEEYLGPAAQSRWLASRSVV